MSETKFTFEIYDGIAYDVLKDGEEWIEVSDQDDAETLCTFLNEQQATVNILKKEIKRLKCMNNQLEQRLDYSIAYDMGECE